MLLISMRPLDIATALVGRDVSDVIGWVGNADDGDNALRILGVNRFHRLCNIVRDYDADSRRAAFLKYSEIFVSERLSAERARAYATHIARPHFSEVRVSSVAPSFSPDVVRMAVAAFQR